MTCIKLVKATKHLIRDNDKLNLTINCMLSVLKLV